MSAMKLKFDKLIVEAIFQNCSFYPFRLKLNSHLFDWRESGREPSPVTWGHLNLGAEYAIKAVARQLTCSPSSVPVDKIVDVII